MKSRDAGGRERYGVPLQAFNGREALVDAYQEALDLVVYLRQEIEERRSIDRQCMVREFFATTNQPIGEHPGVPEEESMRLGLSLIAEEFFELLRASLRDSSTELIERAESNVHMAILTVPLAVNLPELVDATVDIDYVVEGLRVRLGVDSTPVWQVVHQANLAKRDGPVNEHGKKLKPEGWKPPDIEGELLKQGWEP
jgi:predicted HAD superfamily Cof-like phosphohydrolase